MSHLYRTIRPFLRATLLASVLFTLHSSPALAWDPAGDTIAPGVSVGGVPVGELTEANATIAVRTAYAGPVSVTLAGHTLSKQPSALGQIIYAQAAVGQAMQVGRDGQPAPAAVDVALRVEVRAAYLKRWIDAIAAVVDTPAVNATYKLVRNRPRLISERAGYRVNRSMLTRLVRPVLLAPTTDSATAASERSIVWQEGVLIALKPLITRKQLPRVIVIDKSANRLYLYGPRRLLATFRVATGQPRYPTPLGAFSIVNKRVNPTWTPPKSAWAKGLKPIPPGPNNPLGTRWIGLSAPGIGIHGTNNPGSIGSYASHGCVRMRMREVERLFRMVSIGVPVHVVR